MVTVETKVTDRDGRRKEVNVPRWTDTPESRRHTLILNLIYFNLREDPEDWDYVRFISVTPVPKSRSKGGVET